MGPVRCAVRAVVVALLAALPLNAAPAAPRAAGKLQAIDSASLKSISAWLMESGKEGYLAAEVADAAGIPRSRGEDALGARQRGFRSGEVLRVAQVSADQTREFLLFMVQLPQGEVFFYLATVADGLKRAFVSVPGAGGVLPLEGEEARASFQREISYWQARIAGI